MRLFLILFFLYPFSLLALPTCEGSPSNSITDQRYWDNCIGTANIGGVSYTGEFKKNMPHGKGRMIYYDKTVFEGNFKEAMPNGYGVFYDAEGKVIGKGMFVNGVLID